MSLSVCSNDLGIGLLVTLLALSVFSLVGLYVALNATTGVHISDNFESQIQATYAAQAGLNHARALVPGLHFDSLLRGPDGIYKTNSSYVAQAKTFRFRNPVPLSVARSINIYDPMRSVAAIPDDGFISTGAYGGAQGTVLIPASGISQNAPNPHGPGNIVTSRYFVKVTDNNGEVSEVEKDPDDSPFVDGDGIIIVRSLGVAQTIPDTTGPILRRNSVAVYEVRLKKFLAFSLGPALTVQGPDLHTRFDGNFEISGGLFPGIGTIDTNSADDTFPDQIVRSAAGEGGIITGGGLPEPSVRDITGLVRSNSDHSLLLDPHYLWNFVHERAPQCADRVFEGNQSWSGWNAPYAGKYNPASPLNAPGQDPKLIIVNGDLHIAGPFSGGGLLMVTGNFSYNGYFSYAGLVIVIGSGSVTATGSGEGIVGGLFAVSLSNAAGGPVFGTSNISINGNSRIAAKKETVEMALGLIAPSQISLREIAGADP